MHEFDGPRGLRFRARKAGGRPIVEVRNGPGAETEWQYWNDDCAAEILRLASAEAQAAERELALVGLHQLLIEAREGKYDEAGFRLAVGVALEHAALVEAAGRDRLRREALKAMATYRAAEQRYVDFIGNDHGPVPAELGEEYLATGDALDAALAALRAAEGEA